MLLRYGFLCLALNCLFTGCGGTGAPPTYPVTGTVTFEGEPIKAGDIQFEPDPKGEAPDGGSIIDGKFSLRVKEGKKKVKITASREVPGEKKKGAMGEDIVSMEENIPEQYNVNSQIEEIIESGENTLEFKLKSDGSSWK